MIEPKVLLQGYRLGVFPMAMEDGEIEWFSPDPRAILPLDKFHAPHTLERTIRKQIFEIRINASFVHPHLTRANHPINMAFWHPLELGRQKIIDPLTGIGLVYGQKSDRVGGWPGRGQFSTFAYFSCMSHVRLYFYLVDFERSTAVAKCAFR